MTDFDKAVQTFEKKIAEIVYPKRKPNQRKIVIGIQNGKKK